MAGGWRKKPGRPRRPLREFVQTLLFAGLVATIVHTFWLEPFYIPSGSMVPTLLVGDYLLVNKFAYGYSRYSFPFAPGIFAGRWPSRMPGRGDVVVFRPPGALDEDFIKRVIGLPGDKIQMLNGQLYMNGALVARQDAGLYLDESNQNGPVQARDFTEVLPGSVSHPILKRTDAPYMLDGLDPNDTPVYTVPAGTLFMMGDNRDDSIDSRFSQGPVGFVPVENVIGPASVIFFSIDLRHPFWAVWDWPFEIRWGRIFKTIS